MENIGLFYVTKKAVSIESRVSAALLTVYRMHQTDNSSTLKTLQIQVDNWKTNNSLLIRILKSLKLANWFPDF